MRTMTQRSLLVLLLAFCGPAAAQDAHQAATQIEPGVPKQGLTFLDSKLFDSRLSQELGTGKDKVEVEVSGRVPLSAIPARIDRWIVRVAEEGSVEIREVQTVRTRSLFGLLPMLFSAFERASEEHMLEPAKDYNAAILYKRDATGDTIIDRIVFTRKTQ